MNRNVLFFIIKKPYLNRNSSEKLDAWITMKKLFFILLNKIDY